MNRVKELAQLFASSGREQMVREYCLKYQGSLDAKIDGCGNLILHRKGMGKRIAYVCPMDEKGIFLSHKQEEDSYYYCTLGEFPKDALEHKIVLFEHGAKGLIEKEKVLISQGEVREGESGIVFGELTETEETLTGFGVVKGVCCEILLQLMEQSKEGDLWFVFSSLYQLGKKGALAALSQIKPELAFFIEPTSSKKREDCSPVSLDKGPVVKVRDGGFMDTLHLSDLLEDCELPYQLYVSAKAELAGRPSIIFGVPSVILGIPYESEDGLCQTIRKEIIPQTTKLIGKIQRRLEK